jgi:N-acetylglutamate synthase-like GNAT family acetyltransferase
MTEISPAGPADRPAIEALLRSNGLPTEGLELALGSAVVGRDGGRIVGCAGVEVHGSTGLLRSVCVEPDHRGTGLGRRLVERAEAAAAAAGVAELFLLTETASDWFPRLGYAAGSRDVAPEALRESAEFRGACPVSAELLHKRLSGAAPQLPADPPV